MTLHKSASFVLSLLMFAGAVPPTLAVDYIDVPQGSYYEDAINTFRDAGFLDTTQLRFRPNDDALRSEMIKLLVDIKGGVQMDMPSRSSFDDVSTGAWYFEYFEEAGNRGWVRGDSNCYGRHPCTARPGNTVLRAEAAAMVIRVFGLERTGAAPRFADVPSGQWYTDYIQTAADHCILQGDETTNNQVRPLSRINRAEMITMMNRAYNAMDYNAGCEPDQPAASISSLEVVSSTMLRLRFSTDIMESSAENENNYALTRNAGNLNTTSAILRNSRMVELTLDRSVQNGDVVRVSVDLLTSASRPFTDARSITVSGLSDSSVIQINTITPLSARRIRVDFNADLEESSAETTRNYDLTDGVDTVSSNVVAAVMTSSRTVELSFDQNTISNKLYVLEASLMTTSGRSFSDTASFRGYDTSTVQGDLVITAHTQGVDTTVTPGTRRLALGLQFRASCVDDVTVTDITIRHVGSGSTSPDSASGSGLLGLTILDDNGSPLSARVATNPSDNDTATFLRFTTPLVINACEEVSIMIAADFLATGTGSTDHMFSLERASDVDANTDNIGGTYPVKSLEIQVSR